MRHVALLIVLLLSVYSVHARLREHGQQTLGLVERERVEETVEVELEAIDTSTMASPPPDSFWKQLIAYDPPAVVKQRASRDTLTGIQDVFGHWTSTTALAGNIGLDYYPIKVSRLPPGKTVQQLFKELRLDLMRGDQATVIDTGNTQFRGYDATEQAKWNSDDPEASVIHLDMYVGGVNVDDATVITSGFQSGPTEGRWVFVTMYTKLNGEHPVSGNREFGYFTNKDGTVTIYTKGIDRMTSFFKWVGATAMDVPRYVNGAIQGTVTVPMPYKAQSDLWQSLQTKFVAFINNQGGLAVAEPFACKTTNWNTGPSSIYQTFFAPCFLRDGQRFQMGSGQCERTTMLTCSQDGECRPKGGCSGSCKCGRAGANECKCVQGPIVNSANPAKFCSPYDKTEL